MPCASRDASHAAPVSVRGWLNRFEKSCGAIIVSARGTGVIKWTSFSMTWYLSLRPFDALLSTFFRLFFACDRLTMSACILDFLKPSKDWENLAKLACRHDLAG